ncbi:hypothetical protein ACIGKL_20395 [Pseudomonas sp. NPDC077186]|uniref:hypothetical protein n=1 Tax=Pseudomonas sp. NPDC077186 TaxID=3364421 RepID=UPI0037C85C62
MPYCQLHTRPLVEAQLQALLPSGWATRVTALAPGGERWLLRLDAGEAPRLGELLACAWLRGLSCAPSASDA